MNEPLFRDQTPLEIFDQSLIHVNDERGLNYGHPLDNFTIAAQMRALLSKCPDPQLREAMGNITDKLSRLCANPYHTDGWVDIAGYARTGVMVITEMEQRGIAKYPLR